MKITPPFLHCIGHKSCGKVADLGRCNSDGVPSMYAHRIHILNGADYDNVVSQIAHDFKLKFLPPKQRPLYKHLRKPTALGLASAT